MGLYQINKKSQEVLLYKHVTSQILQYTNT